MELEQVGGIKSKTGISRLTTEYLYWHIDSDYDFSSALAHIAFVENTRNSMPSLYKEPAVEESGEESGESGEESDQWYEASIVQRPDGEDGWSVQALIGPAGGIDLSPDGENPLVYKVWIRLETNDGQAFVRLAGSLAVR